MGPFFGMTFKELLAAKHPTTWLDFECGHITEEQAYQRFFADGRACNGPGLRQMMSDTYEYLDGVEALLVRLHGAGYEVHSMSNYPVWYKIIEDKLRVSRYLQWTFVSCDGPMKGLRKPALEAYACAIATLQRPAGELIFVDDRQVNVDAAVAAGMEGLLFRGAEGLEVQLLKLGLQF